jgi:hypothetical protein
MNFTSRFFRWVLAATLGCASLSLAQTQPPAPTPGPGAGQPNAPTTEAIFSLLQEQLKRVDQDAAMLREQFAKLDLPLLKKQFEGILEAVQKGDYNKAQQIALSMDKALGTDTLARSLGILKMRAEKGAEATLAAIKEYLSRPNITPEERKLFEGLMVALETAGSDDSKAFVHSTIVLACKDKLGNEQGQLLAALVISALFGNTSKEQPGLIDLFGDTLRGLVAPAK